MLYNYNKERNSKSFREFFTQEVLIMTPEERARQLIDARLEQSGWVLQDLRNVNPMASLGVAVREYPTDTGPVDYALFVDGRPVGVVEQKKMSLARTSRS